MADIQQAAKWMNEGKRVRRKGWFVYVKHLRKTNSSIGWYAPGKRGRFRDWMLSTYDLLATDWEIAE